MGEPAIRRFRGLRAVSGEVAKAALRLMIRDLQGKHFLDAGAMGGRGQAIFEDGELPDDAGYFIPIVILQQMFLFGSSQPCPIIHIPPVLLEDSELFVGDHNILI